MIEINNLTSVEIDLNFLKKIAEEILKEERKEKEGISIALVGPARIKRLNREYRGKNRVTDVLSFPNREIMFEEFQFKEIEKIEGLGEVIICLREVRKRAKRFKETFEKELARVLIHGILHLLGYNHEKNKEKARLMEEKENYYLSKIFQK